MMEGDCMKKYSFIIQGLVRAVAGVGMILCINQIFKELEIALSVGVNPVSVLTSGILGIPGVLLLYGMIAYQNL